MGNVEPVLNCPICGEKGIARDVIGYVVDFKCPACTHEWATMILKKVRE
ncbi:hypothetical protein NSS91_07475 [Caldifermentibacillus hisashii]